MSPISRLMLILAAVAVVGCDGGRSAASPQVTFELRDFSVTEEKEAGSQFRPASNIFHGTGTLLAPPELRDKTLGVMVEYRDKSAGPSAKPEQQYVLVRAGVGTFETRKGDYSEILPAPDYSWTVVGWHELAPGTLRTTLQ